MREDCKRAYKQVIESIRSKEEADIEDFRDLQAICQHGFLGDAEHKEEYKRYSDYIKETALRQVDKQKKTAKQWRSLYWEILKLESFWFFESYLIYMEHKRPYEKQFYLPRKCTQHIVVEDLQALEDSKTQKMYTLSEPSRVGKLLADDTPILTKRGWITHGELRVGDYVVGRNGEWVKVLFVHPKNVANKRVWFQDHTYIDCHENHEWVVVDKCRGHNSKEITIETKKLGDCKYQENPNHRRNRYALPKTCVVEGEKQNLIIDPYVLGAWLGDGTERNPYLTICNTDTVIVDEVKKHYVHSRTFEQVGCKVYTFLGLRQDLRKYGMCHSRIKQEKYIPEEYLYASVEQRLELLAGLLDTDGTLSKKEHRYHFSTTNERIKDDAVKLINSFGWRTCVTEYSPKMSSSGICGKHTVYTIGFNPDIYIPCRVERKQLTEFSKQKKIYFERVEDIEPKPGNCITVEGGVYRVGKTMKLTHNSTMMVFFLSWIVLRKPESHNALATHSGELAKHFYELALDLFTSNDYCFDELYAFFQPGKKGLVEKSAEYMSIKFVSTGDFNTCIFKGCDGTWTGNIDVTDYLFVDDLVRDRTHSLSPKRMNDTFADYLNKMVDRKNEGAKEVMIGTLWNVLDPIKKLEEMYKGDDRYVFRKIPALDENNESNFKYEVKGFSTEYYLEMREKLIKSGEESFWMAKFQQQPYVREGLLFPLDQLRFFNGILPPDHKYTFITVCDVAFGGGDSVSMPIGLQDEDTSWIYIVDWYFNSSGVKITIPDVASMLIKYGIKEITFEKNTGGLLYAQEVQEELNKRGYTCSCNTKAAPNQISKEDKIKGYEGKIKTLILFLDGTKHDKERMIEEGVTYYERSPQYERALEELSMFVTIGKNEHDDAADSISQLCIKAYGDINSMAEVEVFSRAELGF